MIPAGTTAAITRRDLACAAALFLAVFTVTLAVASRQGIHRDEAYYMDAGEQYVTWAERGLAGELPRPIGDAAIRAYWAYNSEHPPLMKVLYGLSWRLLHTCQCAIEKAWHPGVARLERGRHATLASAGIVPPMLESTAFRIPTMLCFALLAALVFLFVIEASGSRTAALAAALLTVAQPRAFFHAQTASFDLPAATLWFATAYLYWRALGRGTGAAILTGVVYGLFLATKLQSFFLPFALLAHWLWLRWWERRVGQARTPFLPLAAMAVLGPLVLLVLWPWLWHHPFDRFGAYLKFHWTHVHYNFEYLGQNYNQPPYPWHEPLGMLVTTAPVVLLALAAAGAVAVAASSVQRMRGRRPLDAGATGAWLLLCGAVPVAPFLLGRTPIFGETKHWLATMPFLAILAGLALAGLADALADELRLRTARARGGLAALLVAVAFVPAAVETARSHPYGLSHYNALAGGAPGGADLGMNRQFWGYAVLGLFDELNRLPPKTRLYLHDWNHDAYELYLREGRLRPDLADAGMEDPGVRASSAALVLHELHFNKYEYMIWNAYGHVKPAHVLTLDGVPLVTLYRRAAEGR